MKSVPSAAADPFEAISDHFWYTLSGISKTCQNLLFPSSTFRFVGLSLILNKMFMELKIEFNGVMSREIGGLI